MTASNPHDQLTLTAWTAFALAVAICVHQRHFTLSLAHPDSFRVMLHHRCGRVLTATLLWAAFQSLRSINSRIKPLPPLAT